MSGRPDWRLVALGALAAGLGVSPVAGLHADRWVAVALGAAGLALAALRPWSRVGDRAGWLMLLGLGSLLAGLCVGTARLDSIDGGAFHGYAGDSIDLRGYAAAVPRRSDGEVRVAVEAEGWGGDEGGKILLQAPEPVDDLPIGAQVEAHGTLTRPPPWYRATLERQGVGMILKTAEIEPTGGIRGGFQGRLDAVRERASEALGRGMPEREAELARGFVLGQDDGIDPQTVEDFRRAGLSHLLAVSGQNVVLLTLLAAPFLGFVGVPLRARLLLLLGLIAVYVPLAGGGASIQRAGVMGAAALVATMAGRPGSRVYALLAAAVVTLALNPRATGDVGWQLSFAAVAGILLLAGPLRTALVIRLGGGALARGLAEGTALTIAATLATAPLIATHFGTLSVASLLANLLALPAVAPAMWLGMAVAALGQVPFVPVEPLNTLNAMLLGYIAQVAASLGRPGWASVTVDPPGVAQIAGIYAALGVAGLFALRLSARSRVRPAEAGVGGAAPVPRAASAPRQRTPSRRAPGRRGALGAAAVAVMAAALLLVHLGGGSTPGPGAGLRVTVLDIGQGDAILLQPPHSPAVLVDGGPPGDGVAGKLRDAGVDGLAAAVVTHDQSDHSGGIADMLGTVPVRRLVYAFASRRLLGRARAAGVGLERVAEGSELRSGALRLEVLWPPRILLAGPAPDDPNTLALVILAEWRDFRMLLTADAEAEAVPMDPGPIDVLKVAHHGSEDAGLGALLERSAPGLAVISVGADNSYGHPTEPTLRTLAQHDIPVMRTDESGSVVLDVSRDGFVARASG